jgi:CheY-like chemotaxis protein
MMDATKLAWPDIILLDINLPKHNGEFLLRRMYESPICSRIPVIVITSSASRQDREIASSLGARGYFQKLPDFDEFMRLGTLVRHVLQEERTFYALGENKREY